MFKPQKHTTIIGAGPAGAFMAISLARLGFKVNIYEHRDDLRRESAYGNKSFNITLYRRAIAAFQSIGVWDAIKEHAVEVTGNVCHFKNGSNILYGFKKRKNEVLYTIQRNHLANILLDVADREKNITITFNKKCVFIDRTQRQIHLQDTKTNKIRKIKATFVIGADGVNSIVRSFIQAGQNTHHTQEYTNWSYKEVTLTQEMVQELGFNTTTTHTWPRKDSLIIGFPNKDSSQTLMLNLPQFGYYSFSRMKTAANVEQFVEDVLPDLAPLKEYITKTFLKNPVGNLCTVYTDPWYYKDFMVLIGDAAHGILPFYGQGTGSSFEDCMLLSSYLQTQNGSLTKTLSRYQEERKKNTDIIANLAKANFTELKDLDASTYHIMKQKLNTLISLIFPTLWVPSLDTLVAHTRMPYEDALQRYNKQEFLSRILLLDALAFLLALPIITIQISKTILGRV